MNRFVVEDKYLDQGIHLHTDSSEQKKNPKISLRPVQPADAPFLLEVYASTRTSEMALVPWTDEQRHAFISSQFAAQQDF